MRRRTRSAWLPWTLLGSFAFLVWLAADGLRGNGLAEEDLEDLLDALGGSALACEVPLTWRIDGVDPSFDLDERDAEQAVEAAVRLWEDAAGRTLFALDREGGLPIRFVFDDRQAMVDAQNRRRTELAELDSGLEARRADLDRGFNRLNRDIASHNAVVSGWNEQGGVPPELEGTFRRSEDELAAREADLHTRAEALNEAVTERNRWAEELEREFPSRVVQSGHYGEIVQSRRGRIVAVTEREIQIYRFEDRAELVLVLAHELGHALGLGHSTHPEAVMSNLHAGSSGGLHASDVQLLRDRCPDLGLP